jgi:hypothetical protein
LLVLTHIAMNRKSPAFTSLLEESAALLESGPDRWGRAHVLNPGLLQGRPATTHWAYRGFLDRLGARYVAERWVEDGRYLTGAGVSAGIDTALRLASRLASDEMSRLVQLAIEYDPRPPLGGIDWSTVDRDMLRPRVGLRKGGARRSPRLARPSSRLVHRGPAAARFENDRSCDSRPSMSIVATCQSGVGVCSWPTPQAPAPDGAPMTTTRRRSMISSFQGRVGRAT